nr:DNA adenine methylase [Moraxella osloensis]
MKRSPSPLRYPGGKASIYEMTRDIIYSHNLHSCQYAEPYAGGCGLALSLLFNEDVDSLYLNDIDPSISELWKVILNEPQKLVERIESAKLTIEEWQKQKAIQKHKENISKFDLAFSTLYLNRTNRSGIIKAGVIGGIKQNGNYKMDCRFNKADIIKKIYSIAEHHNKINVFNLDAIDFIELIENMELEKPLVMVDPPYYNKGQTLYTNFYKHGDHVAIANKLKNTQIPWLLTYDNTSEIIELYQGFNQYQFNINYSAAEKRLGTELFVTSDYFNPINHPKLTVA